MAAKQLSDGGPDGTSLGQNASDLVGFHGATPSDQAAAMTAAVSNLTIADAAGSPTYSISSVTSTTNAWGFASAQDAIDVLYSIKKIHARLAEVEAILEEKGLCAAN